jgi:predicted transcriptional regulator
MKSLLALGKAVKQRRHFLKITQEDLAQIAEVSLRSLKALEMGKANPTWNQVDKILQALGWEMELKERKG